VRTRQKLRFFPARKVVGAVAGKKRKRCHVRKEDGSPCRARVFPGFYRCLAHEPALKELHRQQSLKANWVRWGKKGDPPKVDMPKLIADLEAHGHDDEAMACRDLLERFRP
jgi:hypothetical protein